MPRITLYQKPTCTTCRSVVRILKESNVDFDSVNYFTEPISKAKIKELLAKMGVSARHILRTSDPAFKRLNLVAGNLSENAIINLMVNHPELLQRPIVEKGKQAILARPAERIRELFQ